MCIYFILIVLSCVEILSNNSTNYNLITKGIKNIIKSIDSNANIGIKLCSLKDNKVVYQQRAKKLFVPASNTKLFTSAAALYFMGPDYKFKTKLLTDGKIHNNNLSGNIYIKFSGDPSLKLRDIENLLAKLNKLKVKEIKGNIFLDISQFDRQPYANGCMIEDLNKSWNQPISALIIDKKSIKEALALSNGLNSFHLNTKNLFKKLLNKLNIKFKGNIVLKKAPPQVRELATHYSKKLQELIKLVLKESDNLYADCIFKKLGYHVYGTPGSWASGTKAVHKFLEKTTDIKPTEIYLNDGSGRSRYNLISPDSLIKLLKAIYDSSMYPIFLDALPACGKEGTLSKRMTSNANQVKAKTGTLNGVSALSGYINNTQKPYAFSIIINDFIPNKNRMGRDINGINYREQIEEAICALVINKS